MDARTLALVQEIFRRERGSFLLYTSDAFPWITSAGESALEKLRKLIDVEKTAVTALGRYLTRRHVAVPFSVSYPAAFTSFNYLALENMVPRLIDSQKKLIADLERDLPMLDDAAIRAEFQKLADVKQRSLAELQTLLPQPAAA